MSTASRRSLSMRHGVAMGHAAHEFVGPSGLFVEELFRDVDPTWSLRAQEQRTRRKLVRALVVLSQADLPDTAHVPNAKLYLHLIEPLRRVTDVLSTEADEGTQKLAEATVSRSYEKNFLFNVAGGTVISAVYTGRIEEIDDGIVGAVLSAAGPLGTHDDEFVVYLPTDQFALDDRKRLAIGTMFEWSFDQLISPNGTSNTTGEIRLLEDGPFTTDERERIARETSELLPVIRDLNGAM